MPTFTLLSTAIIGNPPGTTTVVPPASRATLTFSITGPPSNYAQATVNASSDGGGTLNPIMSLQIEPGGPNTISQQVQFGTPPPTVFDASFDLATPGQGITGMVTLTV